jgi:hypothetical protein
MRSMRNSAYGFVLGLVTTLALWLVIWTEADLRRFSNALGVAVFGLILWRVAATWDLLTRLERVLSVLLALSPLVSAMASFALSSKADLPGNGWLWLVVAHRGACVVMVIWWGVWLRESRGTMVGRTLPKGTP